MRFQIVTCNSVYDLNGRYKESYHEIHEIDNLRNGDHLIATINSIVSNNKLFKDINDTLDSVIVSGDDNILLNRVINFFKRHSIGVDIIEAETAMSIM